MSLHRAIIATTWLVALLALALQGLASTNNVTRHVQWRFTAQNTEGRLLPFGELWVHAPVARTSAQVCGRVRSSHPHESVRDALGNQVLHFGFTNLPPYGVKVLRIEADVELLAQPLSIAVAETEKRRYLKPDHFVEIEDAEFRRLAPWLTGTNAIDKAKEIYRWMNENMKCGAYSAKDRGALHALREKQGDCTEFMYLFVALCRRAQIPARGLGGYVCPQNTVLRSANYHNWAEFYDGERWQLADPHRKVFMSSKADYVATSIIGSEDSPMGECPRFRFKGDGLNVEMN